MAERHAESPNRGPGGRGAGLDREQIVLAALRLMDERGVTALTMRGLGRELGVYAQALYWHFDDRDALCAAVVEHLASELAPPDRDNRPPRDQLHSHLVAIREHWLRHPAALELSRTNVPSTMGGISAQGIALVQELGAPRRLAFDIYRALSWALVGFVKAEAAIQASAHHAKLPATDRRYTVSLPLPSDLEDDALTLDTDATFELLLTLLVDGVETTIANHLAREAPRDERSPEAGDRR